MGVQEEYDQVEADIEAVNAKLDRLHQDRMEIKEAMRARAAERGELLVRREELARRIGAGRRAVGVVPAEAKAKAKKTP